MPCASLRRIAGLLRSPEDSTAEQMTKEEFEAVLDECETKCAAVSCIETEYGINIAEIPMQQKKIENTLVKKNKAYNILLPKLCVHEDRETYISNLIGTMLYEVIIPQTFKKSIHEIYNFLCQIFAYPIIRMICFTYQSPSYRFSKYFAIILL